MEINKLTFNPERDNKIMKLLKVESLSHILGHTRLGDITLKLNYGETEYQVWLDSVPVDKVTGSEVLKLFV